MEKQAASAKIPKKAHYRGLRGSASVRARQKNWREFPLLDARRHKRVRILVGGKGPKGSRGLIKLRGPPTWVGALRVTGAVALSPPGRPPLGPRELTRW